MFNESGKRTFTAGEDLLARRLVKIESGTVTDPPEVVYADAGNDAIGVTEYAVADGDLVSIKLLNHPGTFEIECDVNSAIARGTALYVGNNGVVTDASSGSAIGVALEVGADTAHIEVAVDYRKPTTAAGTTLLDADSFTLAGTVEAALAEIYQHLKSVQGFIPVPLATVLEGDATNVVGALDEATTPVLDMANGDTDSGLLITWASSDSTPVLFQVPLPPDLDVAKDLKVCFRAKMAGEVDTPVISADSYFNEGDTKVEDDSAALGAAYAEKTITIAAADVPAGAQTLTVELTPGAHTTDALSLSAIWIEYARTILTS
jgi:hypothetical protein